MGDSLPCRCDDPSPDSIEGEGSNDALPNDALQAALITSCFIYHGQISHRCNEDPCREYRCNFRDYRR